MNELDRDRFEQLVGLADAYLMGELDPAGLAALERMVCEDSAAAEALVQYLRQAGALREGLAESVRAERESNEPELSDYLSILGGLEPTGPLEMVDLTEELASRRSRRARGPAMRSGTEREPQRLLVIPRPLYWGGLVAAVLLLAVGVWQLMPSAQPSGHADRAPAQSSPPVPQPPALVGRLVSGVDLQWRRTGQGNGSAGPVAGQPVEAGRYRLTHGFAQLEMGRGTTLWIEAPAEVELTDGDGIGLLVGKLAAHVPDADQQFTVQTPTARIVDLGTRFGVEALADGATYTEVFEGRVAFAPRALVADGPAPSPLVLEDGWGAAVSGAGTLRPARPIAPGSRYVLDRDAALYRPTITGQAVYLSPGPADLTAPHLQSAEHFFVFTERTGVVLPRDLTGWLVEPGTAGYSVPEELVGQVSAGTCVDSYFIHSATPDGQAQSVEGSLHAVVRFSRPILAVQIGAEGLLASDPILQLTTTSYGSELELNSSYRGLDSSQFSESVTLSDDRRTLTVNLRARYTHDQIRVLVQAAEPTDP